MSLGEDARGEPELDSSCTSDMGFGGASDSSASWGCGSSSSTLGGSAAARVAAG